MPVRTGPKRRVFRSCRCESVIGCSEKNQRKCVHTGTPYIAKAEPSQDVFLTRTITLLFRLRAGVNHETGVLQRTAASVFTPTHLYRQSGTLPELFWNRTTTCVFRSVPV